MTCKNNSPNGVDHFLERAPLLDWKREVALQCDECVPAFRARNEQLCHTITLVCLASALSQGLLAQA